MRQFAFATVALAALVGIVYFGPDTKQAAKADPARAPFALDGERALDANVPTWLKAYGVPSVGVAVIRDGTVAWTAAYGEQTSGVAATKDTLYNIASMTKPITAEVVLRLASEGKLSLDEPMSPYWLDPDLKDDRRHKLLTPRMSLLHRTGFANWRRQTNKVLSFTFDPGTKSAYSGEGYQYVARFVEKKMGQPFDVLAQRIVFDPIGMTRTAHHKREWFKDRVAAPFDGAFAEPTFADTWNAADLVYATAADYAKFIVSVMNNEKVSAAIAAERMNVPDDMTGEVCGERGLSRENCPVRLGFALGWAVFSYKGETVVMHDGADDGVKTLGFFVPERRFGIVVLTNGENGKKVIREIVAQLYPNTSYVAFLTLQANGS